jgi:hypothetical protein
MSKKILIVAPVPTHPSTAGNRSSIVNYCEFIESLGYEVYYFYVSDGKQTDEEVTLMTEYWQDRLHIFIPQFKSYRIKRKMFGYLRGSKNNLSYKIDDWYPYGLTNKVKQFNNQHNFDVIWVNYIWLSKLLTHINAKIKVLDTHDVFSYKYEKTGLRWFSTSANEESKALSRADYIVAVQENEGTYLQQLTTKKVVVTYRPFPYKRTDLCSNDNVLFFSGNNKHNVDGINKFINEVFEKLKAKIPGVKLLIGGGICDGFNTSDKQIVLLGKFSQIEDFYKQGDIVINPVYQGTGLKVKTFEALSLQKILVTHPHNIIGVPYIDQLPVYTAETPEQYLEHLQNLLSDSEMVKKIKEKVYNYMGIYNMLVSDRMKQILK